MTNRVATSVDFGGDLVRVLGLDPYTFSVTIEVTVRNVVTITTKRHLLLEDAKRVVNLLERYELHHKGEPEEIV